MEAQATFSQSFPQSDLSTPEELPSLPPRPAQRLLPHQRQDLAVQVPRWGPTGRGVGPAT